jgi:hypothetical protein
MPAGNMIAHQDLAEVEGEAMGSLAKIHGKITGNTPDQRFFQSLSIVRMAGFQSVHKPILPPEFQGTFSFFMNPEMAEESFFDKIEVVVQDARGLQYLSFLYGYRVEFFPERLLKLGIHSLDRFQDHHVALHGW